MGNQQAQHPLVNNFFYKFYNYNIEDTSVIDIIPVELYNYVFTKIITFKKNESISNIDNMKHNSILFASIKTRFPEMHEQLIKALIELNK